MASIRSQPPGELLNLISLTTSLWLETCWEVYSKRKETHPILRLRPNASPKKLKKTPPIGDLLLGQSMVAYQKSVLWNYLTWVNGREGWPSGTTWAGTTWFCHFSSSTHPPPSECLDLDQTGARTQAHLNQNQLPQNGWKALHGRKKLENTPVIRVGPGDQTSRDLPNTQ